MQDESDLWIGWKNVRFGDGIVRFGKVLRGKKRIGNGDGENEDEDDIFLLGSCSSKKNKFKKVLMNAFDIDDLGNVVYFLGMDILCSEKRIIVHQLKYELELLKRFDMMDCKYAITLAKTDHKLDSDPYGEEVDATIFKQLIGSHRYMCNTRPNICYAVGMISRFMSKLKLLHYQDAVKILRYIKGTLKYDIMFPFGVSNDSELICYLDFDWCGDRVDKRSTTECMFIYLSALISWYSKKQPVVALSTCEAEYSAGDCLRVKLFR
ncbi:uncharacterized mitochondrial protein AtMg00810-like [Vicia villosa]|uniref:uncharacterized mitochondrial protein AtMg00810-like n=1 Tax=Vicia villosa TaxID=3911 RepID=UPI00273C7AE6|nr:uncharacterized mitochondrial protein AtMg00810-like [Vicia villosa]